MKRLPICALALGLYAAAPAHASGGVSCEARDGATTFKLHIPMSRAGDAVLAVNGALHTRDARAPAALRTIKFTKAMLTRNDFANRKIDIVLDFGKGLPAAKGAQLGISAAERDEDDFRGRFTLRLPQARNQKAVSLTGAVQCFTD